MKLERIREIGEDYKGGLKALARDAGISEATIHRCIRSQKIQASDLEKIAQLLGVSVVTFFDESGAEIEKNKSLITSILYKDIKEIKSILQSKQQ